MSGLLYQQFGLLGVLAASGAMLALCWLVTLSLPVQHHLATPEAAR